MPPLCVCSQTTNSWRTTAIHWRTCTFMPMCYYSVKPVKRKFSKITMALTVCVITTLFCLFGKQLSSYWVRLIVVAYFLTVDYCQFSTPIFSNFREYSQNVIISESVLFPCNGLGVNGLVWKRNNIILNLGTYILKDELRETFRLSNNFSLLFENVSVDNEGVYVCSNRSTVLAIHMLQVIGMLHTDNTFIR